AENDNEGISNGIKEQEQDIRQILFQSLIKNILPEAILEVCIIPNRWYLDQSNDLSQYPPIPVCGTQIDNRIEMEKTIYAELSGLSKKATDCAIKSNIQYKLVNLLKAFIYDVHNKNVQETQETQETETFTDINNPTITKHKGQPPKRLKSSVETSGKRVLKDSTN
ncbi:hypothetical protein RhiirC2_794734, partial [Rhizophagus irregularis]